MSIITFHPTQTKSDAVHSFFAYDPYIEAFLLPLLGPTATLLLNNLTIQSISENQSFQIDGSELSNRVGTGNRTGQCAPVFKQLSRLTKSGLIFEQGENEYLIPKTINPLPEYLVQRLSAKQRAEHDQWINRLSISPLSTQRRRLKLLISRLEIMGTSQQRVNKALLSSGLHPSIISEAIAATSQKNSAA